MINKRDEVKLLKNPHVLLIIYALLISISFHVGHSITNDIDPLVLTFVRFFIASIIFGTYVKVKYGIQKPSVKEFFSYMFISLSLVGYFYGMFHALRYTTPINVSIVYSTVPIFSTIYGAVFLKEFTSYRRVAVLIVVMFGAIWVISNGDINRLLALDFNKGDLMFLGASMCMGMYPILSKTFSRGLPIPVLTFWTLVTGTIVLAFAANIEIAKMDWINAPARLYAGVFYVTVFTTMLTFFIIQYASHKLHVSKVMAYNYIIPVFAIVENIILGKGLPSMSVLPGVLIVVSCTFFFMKSPKN
ncbi:MAG: hypothetical protein C0603_11070 [Denitrovibrio sp.]|nr:MAG: hypothetical protein C0603_11070 [Denitrovibrio sp.]